MRHSLQEEREAAESGSSSEHVYALERLVQELAAEVRLTVVARLVFMHVQSMYTRVCSSQLRACQWFGHCDTSLLACADCLRVGG